MIDGHLARAGLLEAARTVRAFIYPLAIELHAFRDAVSRFAMDGRYFSSAIPTGSHVGLAAGHNH